MLRCLVWWENWEAADMALKGKSNIPGSGGRFGYSDMLLCIHLTWSVLLFCSNTSLLKSFKWRKCGVLSDAALATISHSWICMLWKLNCGTSHFKVKLNDLKMDPSSPVLPATILEQTASRLGCSPADKKLAFHLDEEDELKHLRECFCIPKVKDLPPSENYNYSAMVWGEGERFSSSAYVYHKSLEIIVTYEIIEQLQSYLSTVCPWCY